MCTEPVGADCGKRPKHQKVSGYRKRRKKEKASDLGVIEYTKKEASRQGIRGPGNSVEDIIPLGRLKRRSILQQLYNKMALQSMTWDRLFDKIGDKEM